MEEHGSDHWRQNRLIAEKLIELAPPRHDRFPKENSDDGDNDDEFKIFNCEIDDHAEIEANRIIGQLEFSLKRSEWRFHDIYDLIDLQNWSFSTYLNEEYPRDIHLGYLIPRKISALYRNVPPIVVAFLIELPGGKDFLDRENHNFGWHDHYLDKKHRRSDVILSWDTRWKLGAKHLSGSAIRPIFSERHAEGKAKFVARPELWGDTKRESVHESCSPDLKRDIKEFRCASNKSDAVWPIGSVLTPQQTTASVSGGAVGSQAPKRKNRNKR